MTDRPAHRPTDDATHERRLEEALDPERMPAHIAIIPDGNGRWARQRGLADRVKGHEAGIDAIRDTIESCARLRLRALSIYAFSMDNWKRSRHETSALMRFFRKFLIAERDRLRDNDIRLVHSGRREDLPRYVVDALDKTMALTENNRGMVLNLAVSYSGRQEIVRAAQRLAALAAQSRLDPEAIDGDLFARQLYHPEIGNPDLLIRTSGERRISDFLLYQMSYAEIHFCPVLWPDFRRRHLLEAITDYQQRERRFGREDARKAAQ